MGLITSNGDYNLATLAGKVDYLTVGHMLPYDLYAFGVAGSTPKIFLDPTIKQAMEIASFLLTKDVPIVLDMPYSPNRSPAIGLTRGVRSDENIDLVARACAFILFCMHETIRIEETGMQSIFLSCRNRKLIK